MAQNINREPIRSLLISPCMKGGRLRGGVLFVRQAPDVCHLTAVVGTYLLQISRNYGEELSENTITEYF